jgi:hypothetical protein
MLPCLLQDGAYSSSRVKHVIQFHYVPHGSVPRAVEDYGVVYLGSGIFKIARLTFIALFFVHLFACIFYRVKESTAESLEDVVDFYTSKNVEADVSLACWRISCNGCQLLQQFFRF